MIEVKQHLPAKTLFTKFAILGLYYGITTMTRDNVWKVAIFGILWEGEHVGWIWSQTRDSNGEKQSELQHLQDQMQNLKALSEALIDLNSTSTTVPPETLPHSKKPNNSNVSTSTANTVISIIVMADKIFNLHMPGRVLGLNTKMAPNDNFISRAVQNGVATAGGYAGVHHYTYITSAFLSSSMSGHE